DGRCPIEKSFSSIYPYPDKSSNSYARYDHATIPSNVKPKKGGADRPLPGKDEYTFKLTCYYGFGCHSGINWLRVVDDKGKVVLSYCMPLDVVTVANDKSYVIDAS
ncbi:MAG: hypothetical protein EBR54_02380, partial [Flavobacteriia bacterium]|nr:hypothetical protein [Flavobacteriia bacterium]